MRALIEALESKNSAWVLVKQDDGKILAAKSAAGGGSLDKTKGTIQHCLNWLAEKSGVPIPSGFTRMLVNWSGDDENDGHDQPFELQVVSGKWVAP